MKFLAKVLDYWDTLTEGTKSTLILTSVIASTMVSVAALTPNRDSAAAVELPEEVMKREYVMTYTSTSNVRAERSFTVPVTCEDRVHFGRSIAICATTEKIDTFGFDAGYLVFSIDPTTWEMREAWSFGPRTIAEFVEDGLLTGDSHILHVDFEAKEYRYSNVQRLSQIRPVLEIVTIKLM